MAWHPMDSTLVYRLWMAPFAGKKLAPMMRHTDRPSIRRVLDVGCGPGTNAPYFADCEYLGVDINPGYIADATRRFGPKFRVADVTAMRLEPGQGYDCVLANSLLHHLPDDAVDPLLSHLVTLLAPGGAVHVIELVLPERPTIPHALARLDRGRYPRALARWREIFEAHFAPVVFEPFPVGIGSLAIWDMVYFQGRRPR